jgi:bifunctional UDP-N-acetylglucosamine pyrophosphorylase/glucosamine-1-phosphate N-acetyltransferase
MGINTRVHLAEAETILRRRINTAWMLKGVSMIDPERTIIEPNVEIGQDTTLWPNTCLRGNTRIGANCEIGPDALLVNTQTGDRCRVILSVVENARLKDGEVIGPFANYGAGELRPFHKKDRQLG